MADLWDVVGLAAAGALGFLGGQARIVLDRSRAKKDAAAAAEAEFQLARVDMVTWLLRNTGTADARSVRLRSNDALVGSVDGKPSTDETEVDLPRWKGVEFTTRFEINSLEERIGRKPVLLVEWTSHRGEGRGPVRITFTEH